MSAFSELGLQPELCRAVEELDWVLPTDIQAESIPLILGGGDVMMAAETGSGKTAAFSLPVLQIVAETLRDKTDDEPKSSESKAFQMSVYDRGDKMAVSSDGLICQCREHYKWHGCRATLGVCGQGKWYYEAIVRDEGICRVGWSTSSASHELGTDKFGYGYGGTGKKSNCGRFDDYGGPFKKGDVIGCYLDLDVGEISFSKNGVYLGVAFTLHGNDKNHVFYPAVALKNAEIGFNFGLSKFSHTPHDSGFKGVICAEATPNPTTNKMSEIRKANAPLCIILEPTKELAEQTHQQLCLFMKFLKSPPIKLLSLIGGCSAREQRNSISMGVDVVVATPGKLQDFVEHGNIKTESCRFFVIDEVDALLSQGQSPFITRLYSFLPKTTPDGQRLQVVICSATLHSHDVRRLADSITSFPTWVDLKGVDCVPDTVHQVVVLVDPHTQILSSESRAVVTDRVHQNDMIDLTTNPCSARASAETLSEQVKLLKVQMCIEVIRKMNINRAIVFCRTKLDCDNLEKVFARQNMSCACLHSDRRVDERRLNLQAFKDEKVRFLVCTDVAARGLDVCGLPFNISLTLPDDAQNYVHRIGRVGRADRMGLSISLVSTVPEKVWYHSCPSRGRGCFDTRIKAEQGRGGCCIWYNEMSLLAAIEEHLGVTITQVGKDLNIPVNEFDGKVVYGDKSSTNSGSKYENHVQQMSSCLHRLSDLEKQSQSIFLQQAFLKI